MKSVTENQFNHYSSHYDHGGRYNVYFTEGDWSIEDTRFRPSPSIVHQHKNEAKVMYLNFSRYHECKCYCLESPPDSIKVLWYFLNWDRFECLTGIDSSGVE